MPSQSDGEDPLEIEENEEGEEEEEAGMSGSMDGEEGEEEEEIEDVDDEEDEEEEEDEDGDYAMVVTDGETEGEEGTLEDESVFTQALIPTPARKKVKKVNKRQKKKPPLATTLPSFKLAKKKAAKKGKAGKKLRSAAASLIVQHYQEAEEVKKGKGKKRGKGDNTEKIDDFPIVVVGGSAEMEIEEEAMRSAGEIGENKKSAAPTITITETRVQDFSTTTLVLSKDKYYLGERYSMQIGHVNFPGSRGYGYEAVIFSRDPAKMSEADKRKGKKEPKSFTFNLPSKLIQPMYDVVGAILAGPKLNNM